MWQQTDYYSSMCILLNFLFHTSAWMKHFSFGFWAERALYFSLSITDRVFDLNRVTCISRAPFRIVFSMYLQYFFQNRQNNMYTVLCYAALEKAVMSTGLLYFTYLLLYHQFFFHACTKRFPVIDSYFNVYKSVG